MGLDPQRLLATLKRFPHPSRYWVAYSGGLDSSVLLHAMASLRDRLGAPLAALSLDHGLHADSEMWLEHCQAVCRTLGIPLTRHCLALRPTVGVSLEAQAREARLGAYRGTIAAGELLLTAHHQDDQAETLLLQLLRGGGLRGLAAMPELAPLPPAWLGRPLLGWTRSDLLAYAESHQVSWVDDPSNADASFDRNYLRHRVLPLLSARWPGCAATLSRSARNCAEAQTLIDRLVAEEIKRVRGTRPGTLSTTALGGLDPPLQRALLRHWIGEQGYSIPDRRHLQRVLGEVLSAAPDRMPLVAWKGAEVRRFRDELFVLEPLPPPPGKLALSWNTAGPLRLPAGLGELTCLMPGDDSGRTLRVRFHVSGLRCRVRSRASSQRLSRLFQAHGVPPWLRAYVPLVFDEERLVAVAGLWRCFEAGGPPMMDAQFRWSGHPWPHILGHAGG
jgi:tRNA(Ile)-lysidine synthase